MNWEQTVDSCVHWFGVGPREVKFALNGKGGARHKAVYEAIWALYDTGKNLRLAWQNEKPDCAELETRLLPHAEHAAAVLGRFEDGEGPLALSEAQRVLLAWLRENRRSLDSTMVERETRRLVKCGPLAKKDAIGDAEIALAAQWRATLTPDYVARKIGAARYAREEHVCLSRHWRIDCPGINYERVLGLRGEKGEPSVREHLDALLATMPEVRHYLHWAGTRYRTEMSTGLWLTWSPCFVELGPLAIYSRTGAFLLFLLLAVFFFNCGMAVFYDRDFVWYCIMQPLVLIFFTPSSPEPVVKPNLQ